MSELKKHREAAGFTIKQFSQLTGVCQQTIRNWEKNPFAPRHGNSAIGVTFAIALGCELKDFFDPKLFE